MAVTRAWKVYGADGHRQAMSFGESVHWDWSNQKETRIFEADNFDKTGTNEYSLIRITRDTEKECFDELNSQISDGYFENVRVGWVVEVNP